MGAVAKVEGLNEQQRVFVDAVVAGMSHEDAAKEAGYSSTTYPAHILRSASVQAALGAWCEGMLTGELRTKAIQGLSKLLGGDTPPATRFQAIKLVLERSAAGDKGVDKPMSEMTPAELEAFIAKLQREREAALIDVTPNNGAQR